MSIEELQHRFPNDIEAIIYFEQIRWGLRNRCAYCESEKISQRQADNRFHCSTCRKTFSVTTGTLLHSSKVPLKGWLYVFSSVAAKGKKISIAKISRDIHVSYSTAWYMHHTSTSFFNADLKEVFNSEQIVDFLCRKVMICSEKQSMVA